MKFKVMIHKKVKSQSNSDDCGVFGKSSPNLSPNDNKFWGQISVTI